MKKGDHRRTLKSNRLDSLSHKFVKDEDLTDTPARLFRQLVNKVADNPRAWNQYLRDYLEWVVTTEDPIQAKSDRLTRSGNIKGTYFEKPTLTFNKLLEGLSILQRESCEIIIKTKDRDGNEIIVSEELRILGGERKSTVSDDPKEKDS